MDHIELYGDAIAFHPMSSDLNQDAGPICLDISTMMHEDPSLVLQVEGHTDNGSMWGSSNLELSQERAESVVGALVTAGVEPLRLTAVGFGEDRPLKPNTSHVNKKLNRRVEFLVVPT